MFDQPSWFGHLSVISILPNLRISWSTIIVKSSTNAMYIIFGSVLVAISPLLMVTHISWVARDTLHLIYGKTTQLQITVYLAAIQCVDKWSVRLFATIVTLLCPRWVYGRALSLALGDTNLFIDNWLQISSYPFELPPIAILSQRERITLMM